MNDAELLQHVRSLGVKLWLEADALRYSAPRGTLTPELLGDLKRRKETLRAILRAEEDPSKLPPITPVPIQAMRVVAGEMTGRVMRSLLKRESQQTLPRRSAGFLGSHCNLGRARLPPSRNCRVGSRFRLSRSFALPGTRRCRQSSVRRTDERIAAQHRDWEERLAHGWP